MRSKSIALPTLSALALVTSLAVPALASAEEGASAIEEGKRIAFNRKKGNCLACHAIEGGALPGNIGPPLVNMKERFPNKEKLKEQIWDATRANPYTIMPPFGKHEILEPDELDKVVEFIYSL